MIPNTSYTIGVRAYTSIRPGEWTDREYTTVQIRKELNNTIILDFPIVAVIQTFFITKLNSTAG